ncbi:hypothetical protein D9Q98_009158 [Chlorella vulgaris]|uniref:Calcineurin-like phosphoesterase domain-containing protein n=1 Tax=Chlorella vulgaris TaxID=3077 RepID=A0A9D4TP97_CHLVU|nr:hypothetical protein D9Q98_009158 [Chlorella vulgaris]
MAQRWDTSTSDRIPLRDAPFSGTFAVHSGGIPNDRPSRRKRLFCFSLLAAAVIAVVVASVVVAGQRSNDSLAAAASTGSTDGAAVPDSSGSSSSKEDKTVEAAGGQQAGTQEDSGGGGDDSTAGGAEPDTSQTAGSGTTSADDGEGEEQQQQQEATSSTGGSSDASSPPSSTSDGDGGEGPAPPPPAAGKPASSSGSGSGKHRGRPPPPLQPAAPVPAAAEGSGGTGLAGIGDSEGESEGIAAALPPSQEAASGSTEAAAYLIRFLAVGDWGREGKHNQSEVAELMGRVAADQPSQFIVSTGDNFYEHGLQSASDPLFAKSFMDVYTAQSLHVPWYAVLGNHDMCDNAPNCSRGMPACKYSPLHQLNFQLANREASRRWHLQRSYTRSLAGGKVDFFFIDTSPFILRYYDKQNTWAHCTGGLLTQHWQDQLVVLEAALAASAAEWKIAVGHHPTYSNGHHGNNTELVQHLEPLFEKYNVQLYLTGHDHNLEHLDRGFYSVVVTGAGSETGREQVAAAYSHYYYPYSGFVGVTIEPEMAVVDFYTLEGGDIPAHTTLINTDGSSLS